MTAELITIRVSALPNYADCQRRGAAQMFRQLVERMGFRLKPENRNIAAVIGTAVHRGGEVMMREKALSGDLPSESVVEEVAIERLREQTIHGVTYAKDTPSMSDAETQVRRMTKMYRSSIAPSVQPQIVEEKLEAQVSPTLILTGHADVIAREPGAIRDLKTGARRGNYRPQIGGYSLLARSNGLDIVSAFEDFLQRVSIKKPQPEGEVFKHDIVGCETAASNVLRSMEADIKTFLEGDPERRLVPGDPWAFLANPSSKLCGPKYCVAFGTDFCREHAAIAEEE